MPVRQMSIMSQLTECGHAERLDDFDNCRWCRLKKPTINLPGLI
jgi:hypothetical protein